MQLAIDQDVKEVLEFMQQRFAAGKLCPVAAGVARIAPLLWDRYQAEPIDTLSLMAEDATRQSAASG